MSEATNHWVEAKCAKAFWGQHLLPPYRRLLSDTIDWANPAAGERWLDLGCGGGAITRQLWERTGGQVGAVVAVDCAATNAAPYQKLQDTLFPCPGDRVKFVSHDFSGGLGLFADASFDHAVSGLSISYAQSYNPASQQWTTAAYDGLLKEVLRVLRPGGRFVFSVNVPEPSWGAVAFRSLGTFFSSGRPLVHLKNTFRMMRYGAWLKREARRGRFHYLPSDVVAAKLRATGFLEVEHRLSYARQAYIFRAVKPRAL
jgi:ubiquinone/menaquinone biosynthesis C-methylase UbiE